MEGIVMVRLIEIIRPSQDDFIRPSQRAPTSRLRLVTALLLFYAVVYSFNYDYFRNVLHYLYRQINRVAGIHATISSPGVAAPLPQFLFDGIGSILLLTASLVAGMISRRSLHDFYILPVQIKRLITGFFGGIVVVALFMAPILICGGIHVSPSGIRPFRQFFMALRGSLYI